MNNLSGAVKPSSIEQDEHLTVGGVGVKRVLLSGYDGSSLHDLNTDSQGNLIATSPNSSYEITEATVGTVTTKTLVKTTGSTQYQKTIATDSSDNSISISTWSEI